MDTYVEWVNSHIKDITLQITQIEELKNGDVYLELISELTNTRVKTTPDKMLQTAFQLTEKHYVSAMLGAEYYDSYNSGFDAGGYGAPTDEFSDLGLTQQEGRTIDSWHSRQRIMSFFGRLNYDYEGKYLVSFVARRDGYSKLLGDNRWGFFPGVSAGWVFGKEKFMEDYQKVISFAKLRASYGANGNFVTIVDGTPELTYTAEQVTNIYDKIYKVIVEQNAYFVTDLNQYATTYDVFTAGRAMFCDMSLSKITTFLSEMDDPYGILPIPKYDTNQEEYLSFVNGSTPLVMIAKTEADPEFVGTIVEAMATYNYDNVTPQLFEVATKLQAAQDPASAAMVDYIVRNRIWDLGYYADWAITNVVLEALKTGKDSIASSLDSQGKATKRGLTLLLKNYEKHK